MLRVHNGVTRVADVSPGCGQRNRPPQSCCCCCHWCCCRRGEVEHDEGQTRPGRRSSASYCYAPSVRSRRICNNQRAYCRGARHSSSHSRVHPASLSDQLYAILVKGDRKTAYHDGRRLSDQLPFVCSLADRLKSTMSNVGHFTPGDLPPNEMPSKFTAVRAILVHAAH